MATQRFAEEVLAAQTGFELLELGPVRNSAARSERFGAEWVWATHTRREDLAYGNKLPVSCPVFAGTRPRR